MWQSMVSGIVAIIAVIITNRVTWHLSEKSRRADLFKVVYPEKFRAIQAFMTKAAALHQEVLQLAMEDKQDSRDEAVRMFNDAEGLLHEIQAQEWLLGPTVKSAVNDLRIVLRNSLAPRIFQSNARHERKYGVFEIDANTYEPVSGYFAAFEALQVAVREELRLDELSKVLPKGRQMKQQRQPVSDRITSREKAEPTQIKV